MKTKKKWGGKRPGSGRRPKYKEAMDRYTVRLTVEHAALATKLGKGDLAAGIRVALDSMRK